MRPAAISVSIVAMTAFVFGAFASPARAETTWYVDDDAPADFSTIQAALDGADGGDTIIVRDGYYTGEGNRDIDFKDKAVLLRSDNGPENCVIDAQASSSDPHRCFVFHSAEGHGTVVDGFTITGGYADQGGAIYCTNGSSPVIKNNIIVNNSATTHGGGIRSEGSSPVIVKNMILANEAGQWGGGLLCKRYSQPTIAENTISGNSAFEAGGIGCWDASVAITNNLVTENIAEHDGGGIYCLLSSHIISENVITKNRSEYGGGINCRESAPAITLNTITDNTTNGSGAGIRCQSGWPHIVANLISGNESGTYGGGLFCWETRSRPAVANNVIVSNSAPYGGGVGAWEASPTITRNTIARNAAGNQGGGVWCYCNASVTISNSILRANGAPEGPEIALASSLEGGPAYSCALTCRYSDVAGGRDAAHVDHSCTLSWEQGNIDADPLFADPDNGDYHLKAEAGRWDPATETWVTDDVTSPCINGGDPTSDYSKEPMFNGGRVNMGAYGNTPEASKGKWILRGDANSDSTVNVLDLILIRNRLKEDPASDDNWRADVNEDGAINVLDLIYVRIRLGATRE